MYLSFESYKDSQSKRVALKVDWSDTSYNQFVELLEEAKMFEKEQSLLKSSSYDMSFYVEANKIIAEVYSSNVRFRNIFEKIGFETLDHPNGPTGVLYQFKLF